MTAVTPADRLASLIRTQVAALRQRQAGTVPGAARSSAAAAAPDLSALVAQRVRGIAADDPQREHKALRVFLESVLAAQFGSDLLQDPAFQLMVDQVQARMEDDHGLQAMMRQAAQDLLGHPPGP